MKNYLLKIITLLSFCYIISNFIATQVNKSPVLPVLTVISMMWLVLFVYANIYRKKGEKDVR